jgi:hypothetical protein
MADMNTSAVSSNEKSVQKAVKTANNDKPDPNLRNGKDDKKKLSLGKSFSSDITVETVYEDPVSESPRSNPQTQNMRASAAGSSSGSKESSLKDLMTVLQSIQSEQNSQKQSVTALKGMVDELYYDEPYNTGDNDNDDVDDNNNFEDETNPDVGQEEENVSAEPPAKIQMVDNDSVSGSTSVFKSAANLFKIKESVDNKVSDDLADMVTAFSGKVKVFLMRNTMNS